MPTNQLTKETNQPCNEAITGFTEFILSLLPRQASGDYRIAAVNFWGKDISIILEKPDKYRIALERIAIIFGLVELIENGRFAVSVILYFATNLNNKNSKTLDSVFESLSNQGFQYGDYEHNGVYDIHHVIKDFLVGHVLPSGGLSSLRVLLTLNDIPFINEGLLSEEEIEEDKLQLITSQEYYETVYDSTAIRLRRIERLSKTNLELSAIEIWWIHQLENLGYIEITDFRSLPKATSNIFPDTIKDTSEYIGGVLNDVGRNMGDPPMPHYEALGKALNALAKTGFLWVHTSRPIHENIPPTITYWPCNVEKTEEADPWLQTKKLPAQLSIPTTEFYRF